MSIEELAGVIETLAPRITAPEIAGRSLRGVILHLQKTADDTNPSIVGFGQAIENLANKNLSATELLNIFGMENITVARILMKNIEEMKYYTKAITDTNVAIEQASVNTDNNASRLEQARNRVKLLSIELGERLSPALTFSTSSFGYLIRATMAIIRFFDEYKIVIVSTLSGILAYTIAVNASTITTKLFAFATNIAEKAVRLFNFAVKSNPIGLLVGLVTAAATALLMFSRSTSAAEKAQKMLNDVMSDAKKNVMDEKVNIDLLLVAARDENDAKKKGARR
jgi:hypothetical protein